MLVALVRGTSIQEIAHGLERTVGAINSRLDRLGALPIADPIASPMDAPTIPDAPDPAIQQAVILSRGIEKIAADMLGYHRYLQGNQGYTDPLRVATRLLNLLVEARSAKADSNVQPNIPEA